MRLIWLWCCNKRKQGQDDVRTNSDKYEETQSLLKIYDMYSSESMIIALSWFSKDFEAFDLKDFEHFIPWKRGAQLFFGKSEISSN
jgi:hypothetical protein